MCLNAGCIPSKGLLNKTYDYYRAKRHFSSLGIVCKDIDYDLDKIMKHNSDTVNSLSLGIDHLFKCNGVEKIAGRAEIKEAGKIFVYGDDGAKSEVVCSGIVVATGSEPINVPVIPFDYENIVSSKEALCFSYAPKKLAVIGAGAIGLELGSVWARLNSEVTIIEKFERPIISMDSDLGNQLKRLLTRQGIKLRFSTEVVSYKNEDSAVCLHYNTGESEVFDKVLVAVGRKPYSNLNIDLHTNERGFIVVDNMFKTNIEGIFAIGDVIGGNMLAHKAADEGVVLADLLTSSSSVNGVYGGYIPSVVYTHPEVASIGKTEEEVKNLNTKYKVGKFSFAANSRAKTMDETDGFVKIIAEERTDTVLGIHIIGPQAGTLIGEAAVAMAYGASSEDIALICHSHPDLNEAIREAALSVHFKPIHSC